jgi:hypothetical protein
MRPAVNEIVGAVRDVLRITFVIPVREGRPHPSAWPRGLRELGTATAAIFVLLGLAIMFATPLRQWGDLELTPIAPIGVPQIAMPLLLTGVILSMAMICTAALHTSWWLRIMLLMIGGSAVAFFSAQAWFNPLYLAISLLAYLGLIGFAIGRSFHSYAWWEFPVVALILMVATFVPWLQASTTSAFAPTALNGALLSLQDLILPAVMVAGSAPAQIVVTGAQAAADRPLHRGLFWTGFGIAVVWLGIATALAVGGPELSWASVGASAVVLAVVGITVGVLVRRAGVPVPPSPETYPEVWGRWLYPIAAAVAAVVVVALPVAITVAVAQRLGAAELAAVLQTGLNAFNDNNPAAIWRGVLGTIGMVLAWRLSARDRLSEAVALGTFSVLVLAYTFGQVPGLAVLLDRTPTAIGVLAAAIALIAAVVLATRRRLDRPRAVGVLTVVLLAVLYPHRDLIENPAGVLLALTPAVLLIFGLAWRVFTEAEFTYTGSRTYPQSTRVLLFLANTLFATTGVAYVALGRAAGTDLDPSGWSVLGDTVLGEPLYVAGLATGLWLLLRPAPAGREPELPAVTEDSRAGSS